MTTRHKVMLAGAFTALLLACIALGLAMPWHLVGGASWALVVAAILYGLGGSVRRGLGIDLAISEQLVIGACVWIAATGVLLVLGAAHRGPLAIIAALGLAGMGREIYLEVRAVRSTSARSTGTEAVFLVLLSLFLLLNLIACFGSRGNPADDQASYTALIKRVLDCGDLVEPFSFRRLSAYGGQTMLQALPALRGDLGGFDLLDRGIFEWVSVLLTIQLARRRGVHFAMIAVIVVVLLSLWDLPLNSGALWTGFACFMTAYGLAMREDIGPRPRLLLVFGVLGAACTLRQNYLVPAALFACLLAYEHLRGVARDGSWRTAWISERRTVLLALATTAIVVLPYLVAAFRSSESFLYPVLRGVANPAVPLQPTGGTLLDELGFISTVVFSPDPIRVWWLLLPAMLVARDRRTLRPWRSFAIACGIGFAVLVHAFSLSDSWNLWRYAFGYMTPLAIIFAIETAPSLAVPGQSREATTRGLAIPAAAALLVWIALVVNLIETRTATSDRFRHTLTRIASAFVQSSTSYEPRLRSYAPLQDAIPAGERIAIMLDDPWQLDFARNRIVNLDLPGLAAPGPGLPSFTSPEHWRSYFASQGIRYIAFVDPGASSFMFRRGHWLQRMYRDDELYQHISARMVDALDTFVALKRSSRVVFDRDGLIAVDLGADAGPEPDRGPPERARMDRFIRTVSEDELGHGGWQLANRSTVVFKNDGLGPTPVVLPRFDDVLPIEQVPHAFQQRPHRWLTAKTRVRVFGTGTESVRIKLWIRLLRAFTRPLVVVSLDGEPIAESSPDAEGNVSFDAPARCEGWCDLYIVFNSPFDWWVGAELNGVAQLLAFEWATP